MRSVFYPHLVNGPFGDAALYVRVAHRGEALLFDCGELHRLSVRQLLKLQAVFLSHCHIDHVAGFDTLLRSFLYQDRTLQIFGPPGTAERIGHRLAGTTWNLTRGYAFTLLVTEWDGESMRSVTFRAGRGFVPEPQETVTCPEGELLQTPAWSVRGVLLEHGDIPSLACVLEEPLHVAIHKEELDRAGWAAGPWLTGFKDRVRRGVGARAEEIDIPLIGGGTSRRRVGELLERIAHTERGMKLAYVTDVAPTPENEARIVALAEKAHLLAIEATFAAGETVLARERNHLTAQLAGTLARRAGVQRLLLFHHSPRYEDDPLRLPREAAAAFGGPVAGLRSQLLEEGAQGGAAEADQQGP